MELCLGTVQFGMDYGIFDQKKKRPEYCIRCLDHATQNGIRAIDTAAAYGMAEEVVGRFLALKTVPRDELFISTKLLPNLLDDRPPEKYVEVIRMNLQRSLETLHTDHVDAYLLHSARYAFRPDILEALSIVQKEGLALKVGVSVYDPEEALACYKSPYVDHIQVPYSVFDHRMKESGIFDGTQMGTCSVDVRTAFIKGLIRLGVSEVPDYLAKARPILEGLDLLCQKTGYSRVELAMGYIKREKNVRHLVFGIRTLEQLKEDIQAFQADIPSGVFEEIDQMFSGISADIVVPSLWKR